MLVYYYGRQTMNICLLLDIDENLSLKAQLHPKDLSDTNTSNVQLFNNTKCTGTQFAP